MPSTASPQKFAICTGWLPQAYIRRSEPASRRSGTWAGPRPFVSARPSHGARRGRPCHRRRARADTSAFRLGQGSRPPVLRDAASRRRRDTQRCPPITKPLPDLGITLRRGSRRQRPRKTHQEARWAASATETRQNVSDSPRRLAPASGRFHCRHRAHCRHEPLVCAHRIGLTQEKPPPEDHWPEGLGASGDGPG